MSHTHDDDQHKKSAWEQAWTHPFFTDGPDNWIANADAEQLSKSFLEEGGVLMCIDEGVDPDQGQNAVYMAGSGILFQKDAHPDPVERRQKLVEELRGKKITGISSHADCGACALFCKEAGSGVPEDVACTWAQDLANDLGVPYVGHITPNRPEFHHALMAYYDGTGKFVNPQRSGLPTGFIISRAILHDAKHAAFELELASAIALGAHGFGAWFTPEKPFTFCIVFDPNNANFSKEKLLKEVEPIIKGKPHLRIVTLAQPVA